MTVTIGLGTAQFGQNYGIANRTGKPSQEEINKILSLAHSRNISIIDTASAYGDAETLLGRSGLTNVFRIITKIKSLGSTPARDVNKILFDEVTQSLRRLKLGSVHGLLVHHVSDLLGPSGDAIYKQLVRFRNEGLTARIGLSAYRGTDVRKVLSRYDIDLIQLPLNVFDQRLLQGGQLRELRLRGVEIHARSIFLQGLLLMDPDKQPPYFSPIRQQLESWRDAVTALSLTPRQGALAFLKSVDVDVAILGVDNFRQLEENLLDFTFPIFRKIDFTKFSMLNEDFLNPSHWKQSF